MLKGAKTLVKSRFFPSKFAFESGFKFSFILGVGGNIGNSKARFEKLFLRLRDDKRFHVVLTSSILQNEAFGYKDQADFLNAVMLIQTSLSPFETLKICMHLENIFGRKRSFKNAPRTLDLDILYFSAKTRKQKKLILPHPGVNERISVIYPLGEIL